MPASLRPLPARASGPWRLDRLVPRGALLLSVLTFGSYLMGLVRDRILTRTFGAGTELDTFNAAFTIPELSFGVIVASGLAAPFIPIYTAEIRERGERAGHHFAQTILTLALVAMGLVSLLLLVIAPLTVEVVAPGFGPEQRQLYTDLFRVMTITQVLFAGSMALGEVLVAERRFFFYGAAPLLYNLGIVTGTLVLADRVGVFAPAIGAVLGASLHLGLRLVGVLARTSYRPRPRLALRSAPLREFFRLALPKTASSPVEPVTFLFFTSVASGLAAGSITAISLARNFQSVPISLIGVAFSLAAFPALAAAFAAGDRHGFLRQLVRDTASIGILTTGAALGLVVVGPVAIEVLLGGGRFDADDVASTAAVLAVFAVAVPFESLGHLFSRAIYATHHTVLQVLATLAGFAITVLVTVLAVPVFGVLAIPAGYSLGAAARCGLLGLVLLQRLRRMRSAVSPPRS